MIILTVPKWNLFADYNYESYISASANPGEVSCGAVTGFGDLDTNPLYCEMTQGEYEEDDTIRVLLG